MNYEHAVMEILFEAGERGLPVSKIARHVHHRVNSLFEQVSYDEVYGHVRRYVHKNSRNSYSLFEHAPQYGHYRVNRNSENLRQLRIDF